MSRSKAEKVLEPKDTSSVFSLLTEDVVGVIASHLSVTDELNVMRSSITTHNLFKPNLNAIKARNCVVQGDLDTLKLIAQRNLSALFQKGHTTDPRERTFYNASAYQLIQILCDVDMKNYTTPLITDEYKTIRQLQFDEMGSGGADLIKLDRDPLVVAYECFKGLTEFKQTFTLSDGTVKELTFPLLENVDGIIFYQDANKEVHFYYVNRETKEINPLEPCFTSEEDKTLFAAFKASFESMENNSGRRSSDAEHQLIKKLMQIQLHRQGIHYEHQGIRYRDSCTAFNLIHAYRKSIRLYDEAEQNNQYEKAHTYWCEGVGKAQGEEMWLLQRICEENRPFHPLPEHFKEFKRAVTFYDWMADKKESGFAVGKLVVGLGSDSALYKGWCDNPVWASFSSAYVSMMDLIAVCQLVEDAK